MKASRALNPSEKIIATLFALSTGALLSYGFLPTAQRIVLWLWMGLAPADREMRWHSFVESGSFPLLAAFFLLTIQRKPSAPDPKYPTRRLLRMSLLPCLIALGFGFLTRGDGPIAGSPESLWICLWAPLGEELLFRGWLYEISFRIWPNRMATRTNPFPVALWVSSIAFSLWHLQNLSDQSFSFVLFQMFYTFWAGFWLGFLRWKSGQLALPLLGHLAINGLAFLGQAG